MLFVKLFGGHEQVSVLLLDVRYYLIEGHQLEVLIPQVPPTRAMRLETTAAASEKDSVFLRGFAGPDFPSGVDDVQIFGSKGREWKFETAVDGLRQRSGLSIFSLKPHELTARISDKVLGARDSHGRWH